LFSRTRKSGSWDANFIGIFLWRLSEDFLRYVRHSEDDLHLLLVMGVSLFSQDYPVRSPPLLHEADHRHGQRRRRGAHDGLTATWFAAGKGALLQAFSPWEQDWAFHRGNRAPLCHGAFGLRAGATRGSCWTIVFTFSFVCRALLRDNPEIKERRCTGAGEVKAMELSLLSACAMW